MISHAWSIIDRMMAGRSVPPVTECQSLIYDKKDQLLLAKHGFYTNSALYKGPFLYHIGEGGCRSLCWHCYSDKTCLIT
mgnify:CR=1 FL=1